MCTDCARDFSRAVAALLAVKCVLLLISPPQFGSRAAALAHSSE